MHLASLSKPEVTGKDRSWRGGRQVTVPDFSVNLAKQSKTYEDDVYKETTKLNWGRISKELALNWRKIDVKLT